ncbi:MAG: phosphoenolpyruvate synthase [Pseudomonadales bacterium]
MGPEQTYVRWFAELDADDIAFVGGKNAALGEMVQHLSESGVPVPNGFALTTQTYREICAQPRVAEGLEVALRQVDFGDVRSLQRCGAQCRDLIYGATFPASAAQALLSAHKRLRAEVGDDLRVAVRSSATAEDLPGASFAGQHDTFLNVAGGERLIEACRQCLASLFTDRAIRYRHEMGFDHLKVALSVGVMQMVRSDLAVSGVMFTVDTESGFPDVVLLNAAYGLGDNVVQGAVDPDEYYVHKPTFRQGHRTVLRRNLGAKQLRMRCGTRRGGGETYNEPVSQRDQACYALADNEVLELADYGLRIEEHYSGIAERWVPMDIEWAKDGIDGKLYIVQARPETVSGQRDPAHLSRYRLLQSAEPVCSGRAVGQSVATGVARIIHNAMDLRQVQPGDVLVAEATAPDWVPVLKDAAAIVTDRGGRTCHAAIVARELGIPAVVGCGDATTQVTDQTPVTVSCAAGETGHLYAGTLPFEKDEFNLATMVRPRTQIMVNVANPELAFRTALLPNDGVGLARIEFIIGDFVGAHPMALAHPERIRDPAVKQKVLDKTRGFDSPADYFISRLSEGVGTIAAAFYPKPVVVRMSDFKTNEYAHLLGGQDFEVAEENPMLGFRGASRYAHPAYQDGFALECQALARVRSQMGLTNVKVMVPFCRRIPEAISVLGLMARHGLERGVNGLEVYVMCEIPNNVILIDEFARHFDGFSIGSNDLTQLTLGVDRDSEVVAFDFDERDPGVMKMLELAIAGAKRNGRYCGICGQAPSDYPEVAEFLVRHGIDGISLSPDSVFATTEHVLAVEAEMNAHRLDGSND